MNDILREMMMPRIMEMLRQENTLYSVLSNPVGIAINGRSFEPVVWNDDEA